MVYNPGRGCRQSPYRFVHCAVPGNWKEGSQQNQPVGQEGVSQGGWYGTMGLCACPEHVECKCLGIKTVKDNAPQVSQGKHET
jgi:hypothetical protein